MMMAFSIGGCNNAKNEGADNKVSGQSANTLEKIRSSKEIHVGYFVSEPAIMEDPNSGKKTGVLVDLIESIAKSLDAKVIYHEIDLANFVAGLQSHQFDICIGSTFATPKRASSVLFTRAIYYSGYTGVSKKGRSIKIKNWHDLDHAGLKIAVKQGSAIDDFVGKNFKESEIIRLSGPDLSLPLVAVSSNQADVGLVNKESVFAYLRVHPELEEVLPNNPITPTNYSWSVRPDDVRLLEFLNSCLEYMENTGVIYQYEQKYGIPLLHNKRELVYPKDENFEIQNSSK